MQVKRRLRRKGNQVRGSEGGAAPLPCPPATSQAGNILPATYTTASKMPRKRPEGAPPPRPRNQTDMPVRVADIVHSRTPERPLLDTFYYLLEKYPRETWGTLSYRKQVCLAFLEWFSNSHQKELMLTLVDMVVDWRRIEGRVGSMRRTLLERMVRQRLLKKAAAYRKRQALKEKARQQHAEGGSLDKAKKEGRGIFSPKYQDKAFMEEFRRKGREKAKLRQHGDKWIVTSPYGETFHITNLRAFCEENQLNYGHMKSTSRKPDLYHKGWKARKLVKEWPIERMPGEG